MNNSNEDLNGDYRDSHKSRGENYDEIISSTPVDAYMDKWEALRLTEVVPKLLANKEATRYLDFACGTGRVTKVVEKFTDEAVGVDISESMLEKAKENTAVARFVHADLTQDETDLGVFQLATSFRFFGNAQDELRISALTAINKHLEVGGFFIINNHRNPLALKTLLFKLTGGSHELDLTDKKISNMLAEYGFEIVLKKTIGFWMFRDSIASKNLLTSKLAVVLERMFQWGFLAPFSQDTLIVARKIGNL